jgi:hypothetical protein
MAVRLSAAVRNCDERLFPKMAKGRPREYALLAKIACVINWQNGDKPKAFSDAYPKALDRQNFVTRLRLRVLALAPAIL